MRNGSKHRLNIGVFPVIGMNELYEEQAKVFERHVDTAKFMSDMRMPHDDRPKGIAWERLDYSKGLPNKFDALSIHLARISRGEPGYTAGATTHFSQVASYGRDNTIAYKVEKAKVDQAYSSLRHVWDRSVAHMIQTAVPRPVLLGAARQTDYSLVTPLIDGMNLAGIEYVFANRERDNPGVLILSNQTGLAGVLGDAAILVDPMRPLDIANGLREAVNMTPSERRAHNDACVQALSFNSNSRWQNELISATIKGADSRRGPQGPAAAAPAAP
jgi:trehalose 6-phosphate synthase